MASESPTSSLPLPQIIAALLAISSLFVQSPPLLLTSRESAHASGSQSPEAADGTAMRARLWQDPLQVVTGAAAKKAEANDPVAALQTLETLRSYLKQPKTPQTRTLLLIGCIPEDNNPESVERRLRTRAAVLAGLGRSGFVPSEKISYCLLPYHADPVSLADPFPQATPAPLPQCQVIVPYEVLQAQYGLWEYEKEKVDRVVLLWLPDNSLKTKALPLLGSLIRQIPGTRLPPLHIITRILGPSSSTVLTSLAEDIRYLRPHSAESHFYETTLKGIECIAAMPTISPAALDLLTQRPTEGSLPKCMDQNAVTNAFQQIGMPLLRTVQTDDEIIREIFDELDRRGIHACPPREHNDQTPRATWDDIAVVTEWDTVYGRSLSHAVQMVVEDRFDSRCPNLAHLGQVVRHQMPEPYPQKAPADHRWIGHPLQAAAGWSGLHSGDSSQNIWVFNYFKGIDGKGADTDSGHADSGKDKASKDSPSAQVTWNDRIERAQGYNQADYLRRLADHIQQLDAELSLHNRHLRAVLVLGSDCYDKLLVMRALRPALQDALLMTNNLDADMTLAEESIGTRNLVIVSPYGLNLDAPLQRGFPIFRDSYQTAVFCSTLIATGVIDKAKASNDFWPHANGVTQNHPIVSPRIFENARSGFYDLSLTRDKPDDHLQPPRGGMEGLMLSPGKANQPLGTGIALLLGVIVIGIAGFIVLAWRNRRSLQASAPLTAASFLARREWMIPLILLVAMGTPILLSTLAMQFESSGSEPLTWLQGISAWPTQGLRLAAVLLTLHLLAQGWLINKGWRQRIDKRFFKVQGHHDDTFRALRHIEVLLPLLALGTGFLSLVAQSLGVGTHHLVVTGKAIVLVLLLIVSTGIGTHTTSLSHRLVGLGTLLGIGGTLIFLSRNELLEVGSSPMLSGQIALICLATYALAHRAMRHGLFGDTSKRTIQVRKLWSSFTHFSRRQQRMTRVGLVANGLYWAAVCLLECWPSGQSPARGTLALTTDAITFSLGMAALAVITATVMDVVLLERLLIAALQSRKSHWRSVRKASEMEHWWQALGPAHADAMDMRLLRESGESASWLAYTPFIVLAALIFAQWNYFDSYQVNNPLKVLWASYLGLTCLFQWALYKSNLRARSIALQRLGDTREHELALSFAPHLDKAEPNTPDAKSRLNLINDCIAEITAMRTGAFAPFWEQPFMKAIVFSSGSLGLSSLMAALPAVLNSLRG